MVDKIQHFTDLIAWQKNSELVLEIYKTTKTFPKEEIFGITSQIRRSANSIIANIAEGFGRQYKAERIRFYNIARGSSTETQSHLIIAFKLDYLNEQEYQKLKILSFEGYKILCGLIKSMS